MTPSHTTRKRNKRYRYYVCTRAQKRGWQNCPSKSIPAEQIEQFVVKQIKSIAQDSGLVRDVVMQTHSQTIAQIGRLKDERVSIASELEMWNSEIRQLVTMVGSDESDTPALARLADMQDRLRTAEGRAVEVHNQEVLLKKRLITADEVSSAMAAFDALWEMLSIREQIRIIHLIVEQVDYDGRTGKVTLTFRPEGVRELADDEPRVAREVVA